MSHFWSDYLVQRGFPRHFTHCLPYFPLFLQGFLMFCIFPWNLHVPFFLFWLCCSIRYQISQCLHLRLPFFTTLSIYMNVHLRLCLHNLCPYLRIHLPLYHWLHALFVFVFLIFSLVIHFTFIFIIKMHISLCISLSFFHIMFSL